MPKNLIFSPSNPLMPLQRYINYNSILTPAHQPVITADNRSFRYGDGFFETMKMLNGKIILEEYHMERLFSAFQMLQFEIPEFFNLAFLLAEIQKLVVANNDTRHSRIRLTIFRSDGLLTEVENNTPNFIVQSWPVSHSPAYNETGVTIGLYNDMRISTDNYANLKSNNYLPYAMAVRWYKSNGLDDALLLNSEHRIAEASTSNVFIVKGKVISTPHLSEGCVAGVTRRFLLTSLKRRE